MATRQGSRSGESGRGQSGQTGQQNRGQERNEQGRFEAGRGQGQGGQDLGKQGSQQSHGSSRQDLEGGQSGRQTESRGDVGGKGRRGMEEEE